MKTSNGWTVKRIKNPHPKKWTGPWFAFKRPEHCQEGQANWRTLINYIGKDGWIDVCRVYEKTLKKVLDN